MSPIKITPRAPLLTKSVRLAVVVNCHTCPHIAEERTPGAGCADDYYCTAVTPRKLVVGYVEYPSEKHKNHEFPDWCPLEKRSVP